ncbi:DUF3102 domain-containing protein [Rhizobium sp. NRK18]|uniref:DUF3102 domain-containing protein n=1 Tax=Rhizobium sp. NRK18 TaxID=2964667 RepID=UPI0021C3D931|nr:DUF3102 domain-containing protein [Rhizobium sp. NRK18]MCQ2005252.1 DUF3102 domain-containing protein [Rhizobium sp. NRK18]
MTDLHITNDELKDLDYTNAENIVDVDTPEQSPGSEPSVPASPAVFGFDYSGVSLKVAQEAEAAAIRIRDRHRLSIIDTGHDLCAVKDKLEHGQFGNWLSYHFGMSERTAQNYMNAATVFGSAPKVIDVLPPVTIYKLAAKGAPEEIRQSVIDAVDKGLLLDHKEVNSQIATAQKEARQRREEERAAKHEQRAWEKNEKALRAEGKTDEEIKNERKRWDRKIARKERDADKKALEASQREEAALQREERLNGMAAKAVNILKARLAADYETFRDALLQLDYVQLKTAMLNA